MTTFSDSLLASPLPTVAWTLLLVVGLQLARTYLKLRSVPGPLLASITNLPRLYWTWTRKPFEKHLSLHKKYGKLVRMGPNMVSISDPGAIPTIYGFNYDFQKVSIVWSEFKNASSSMLLTCHDVPCSPTSTKSYFHTPTAKPWSEPFHLSQQNCTASSRSPQPKYSQ